MQLTGQSNTDPTWSPDGTKIGFVYKHNGVSDVYVINVDGTGCVRLTFDGDVFQTAGLSWTS